MFAQRSFASIILCCVLVSTASSLAVAADLTGYDYVKVGNNRVIVYKHSGVNAKDRARVGRDLKRIQKYLSVKPASPTHVHMFHSKKSNLLAIGKKTCDIQDKDWPSCPSDWANSTGKDSEAASVDGGGRAEPDCQIQLAENFWSRTSKEAAALAIIAHEYFHCHQFGLAATFEATKSYGWAKSGYPDSETGVGVVGPDWLTEGGAAYFGVNYAGKRDKKFNYKNYMRQTLLDARTAFKKGNRLQKHISQNQSYANGRQYSYDGGTWAMAYLAHHKGGNKQVFTTYYKDIAELERIWRKKGRKNYGWQASFKKNFGLTPKQFYKKFNKFMKKPIAKQMKILMSPLKK